ncbi:glutathione ABC transporter substrate-binding protein [Bacillaceae bacterium W0354]
MKSNKLFWLFALMLSLMLVLAACAGDGTKDEPEKDGDDKSSETDKDDNKDEEENASEGSDEDHVIIAMNSDIVDLDPHGQNDVPSSNVRSNIYDTLIYQTPELELVPSLATEWEQKDPTTWVFKLRDDVKFHDGTDFNAEVVKANLERVLDPIVGSPRSFLYSVITDIEVLGDYEIQIKTEYPFAPLLAHLAHDGGGMLSKAVIDKDYEEAFSAAGVTREELEALAEEDEEAYDEALAAVQENIGQYATLNPIGTGPFKLDERKPGELVTIARFDDHWGEKAVADKITFKVVKERSTRIAELESGTSHIIDNIGPDNVERLEANDDVSVHYQDSVSLNYIGFNGKKEPFDNKLVRQAVSWAIDGNVIVEGILSGYGLAAKGPLAPDVFGYDPDVEGIGYDVDKAKELLAEAGYEDGFSTTIWTNDNPDRRYIAEYVQQALKELNIKVEIEELEWGAYLEKTANGEHDMFILGWSTVTADADYGLYALFHSSSYGSTGNRSFISDPELDELLDKGRQEADPEKRQEYYSRAQEILADLAPMVYVNHSQYLNAYHNSVKGFDVNPLGIFQLRTVTTK